MRVILNTETSECLGFSAYKCAGEIATDLETGNINALIGADIETAVTTLCESVLVQMKRKNDCDVVFIENAYILYVRPSIICHRAIARVAA